MLVAQSRPALCDPMHCSPRLLCSRILGKNPRVRCHSLLHGIVTTEGSNLGLLYCRQILYHLSHQGSPIHFSYLYERREVCILELETNSCMLSHFNCAQLTQWTVACQASLSMGFSRQEYWSGSPCPSPRDLRDPRNQARVFVSCIGRWVLYH